MKFLTKLLPSLVWFGLILLCVLYVDTPAARLSHNVFGGTENFRWLIRYDYVPNLMTVGIVFCVVMGSIMCGWRPKARILIKCILAFSVVMVLKTGLKLLFGRSNPEVVLAANSGLGFHFFGGGGQLVAFPSGHMAMISVIMMVCWQRIVSLRWLWVICMVAGAALLYITNVHFISDIMAGFYLGALVAFTAVHLLQSTIYAVTPKPPFSN